MARGQLRLGSDDAKAEAERLDEALAAFGLYCDETVLPAEDEFWLWPEGERAFELWLLVQTQWNEGLNGRSGLNYPGVEVVLRIYGVGRAERQRLFGLLQMMEQAALDEWAQRK